MKRLKSRFYRLSMTSKQGTLCYSCTLGVMCAAIQSVGSSPSQKTRTIVKSTSPKIEVKTETITGPIPFTTSTVSDDSLVQGITQAPMVGVNGALTQIYHITYTNGVETSRSTAVDTVKTPPINAEM